MHIVLVDVLRYNVPTRQKEKEVNALEYITVKEAAIKWGYRESTIRKWCKEGLLSVECKAEKKNGRWQIPVGAVCPKPVKQ